MTAPNPADWPPEAYQRIRDALAEPLPEPEPLPDFIYFGETCGLQFVICTSGDCCGFENTNEDLSALEEKAWVHVDDWHQSRASREGRQA